MVSIDANLAQIIALAHKQLDLVLLLAGEPATPPRLLTAGEGSPLATASPIVDVAVAAADPRSEPETAIVQMPTPPLPAELLERARACKPGRKDAKRLDCGFARAGVQLLAAAAIGAATELSTGGVSDYIKAQLGCSEDDSQIASQMSGMLDRLAGKGLLEVKKRGDDKYWRLTDKGRAWVAGSDTSVSPSDSEV